MNAMIGRSSWNWPAGSVRERRHPVPNAIPCNERDRLVKQHNDVGARFDAARKVLNERMGIGTRAEFWRLSEDMDNAWIDLRRARALLDSHIREHSC
jgi:hypothetical protein